MNAKIKELEAVIVSSARGYYRARNSQAGTGHKDALFAACDKLRKLENEISDRNQELADREKAARLQR